MKRLITNNFWAKLVTLALAVATWFYIFDVINSEPYLHRRETDEAMLARYNFLLKEVPIKPLFYGRSPRGYRVIFEDVRVEPEKISIFGPREALDKVDELRTERIDLRDHTSSVQVRLGLSSDIRYINLDKKVVDVFIPIEPVERSSR